MLEPRVHGRRVHQVCRPQLLDPAKTLKFRGVDQLHLQGAELDVPMNGIAQQFGHSERLCRISAFVA